MLETIPLLIFRAIFVVIAALGILAALGTVLARNLIHAALFLIAFFFVVACQFVLLDAEFLAAIQVLVYIGAVAVLILFGIMLTRNIQGDETTGGGWVGKVPAGIIAAGLLALLIAGLRGNATTSGGAGPGWSAQEARPTFQEGGLALDARAPVVVDGMALTVGNEMLTRYVVAFEVAGLLLTAAVVGAVALAHGDGGPEPSGTGRGGRRSTTSNGPTGARSVSSGEPYVSTTR